MIASRLTAYRKSWRPVLNCDSCEIVTRQSQIQTQVNLRRVVSTCIAVG